MDLGKTPTFNRLSTKITVSPRVDMVFVLYYVDFLGILHECVLSPTYVLFRLIYYQRHPMLPELKVSFASQTMFPHQGGNRGWSIKRRYTIGNACNSIDPHYPSRGASRWKQRLRLTRR